MTNKEIPTFEEIRIMFEDKKFNKEQVVMTLMEKYNISREKAINYVLNYVMFTAS